MADEKASASDNLKRPVAVLRAGQKPVVLLDNLRAMKRPRGLVGRIQGRERPAALPMPARHDVKALTPTKVYDKWSAEAAGIRAVEYGDNVITMFDTTS